MGFQPTKISTMEIHNKGGMQNQETKIRICRCSNWGLEGFHEILLQKNALIGDSKRIPTKKCENVLGCLGNLKQLNSSTGDEDSPLIIAHVLFVQIPR